MLILIHNFYTSSRGLCGGGLGLKTAWAWFRLNPCCASFNITAVWFHEARGSQFNVPIRYPPLIYPATLVRAKFQVPASGLLLNHPAPLRFLNHNKLAPSTKPYLGGEHCLVLLLGLRLRQGPYCMACERTFAKNLYNIGWKPWGPAYRPVERENHHFSYILELSCWRVNTFKVTIAWDSAGIQYSRKICLSAIQFGLALYKLTWNLTPRWLSWCGVSLCIDSVDEEWDSSSTESPPNVKKFE